MFSIVLSLCLISGAFASSSASFDAFIAKHSKPYALGSLEYNTRFAIYQHNAVLVQNLNQQAIQNGDSVRFSIDSSPYGDMLPSEFRQRVLMKGGLPPQVDSEKILPASSKPADLPASFDWRDKNAVNPVRDQGALGTCWAFSTAENIEGQRALKYKTLEPLSVEQLVECDASVSKQLKEADCGMFGGWPSLAYDFLINAGGLRTEKQFPYCSGAGNCYPCMATNYDLTLCGDHSDLYCNKTSTLGQANAAYCSNADDVVVKLTGWNAISQNETEIAQHLVNVGPLSVLLNADALQFYSKGIYKPGGLFGCNNQDLDHAVLLVGFGSEGGVDYWIVKNSWAATWGEKGYFRIQRGVGACGINLAVTTAVIA